MEKLAAAAGASKSYVWELENKDPPGPSADKLSGTATALGVTIDHLVNGVDSLPGVERMRSACIDAIWNEAFGWQSARTYSGIAELLPTTWRRRSGV